MKKLSLIAATALFILTGCGSKDKAASSSSASETPAAPASGGSAYFEFTADGKSYSINAEDISSKFSNMNNHPEFKIFAGKDGDTGDLLTVPKDMKGPSSTPSGSANFDDNITQGSVSLQNFPEKNYTTNSFNTADAEMSVPVPDAVVITSVEDDGKDAKIITGTFNAKTFGSHSKNNTDAKDTDHTVKGKFRIRHEFTSMSGDRF